MTTAIVRRRADRAGNTTTEAIRFGVGQSSLGAVLVASGAKGIVAILIGERSEQLVDDLRQRFPKARITRNQKENRDAVQRVVTFIEKPDEDLGLPIDMRGTAFQRDVWNAVSAIPKGRTTTFTEIANRIGAPQAIRAVGNACSTNNLAVAIPCHRVVRKDGSLSGGYHWGEKRQRALLDREATSAQASSHGKLPRRRGRER
jgi:AraC family transcriptional regulator, regulatory protein of adaptative response / methylated-DNA-[protein]-cysteine methyltransferase